MSGIQKNSKYIIIAISFILIFALTAVIFGIEYSAVTEKIKESKSRVNALTEENKNLEAQNSSNAQTINDLNSQNSNLQEKNNQLIKENSSLKAMKAKPSSKGSKTSKVTTTTSKANPTTSNKIDMSLLTKENEGKKICYLTFDDGPSDNTLKILEILKKANAKASFFVIGKNSKLSYIKKAYEEGHTIALHTYTHNFANIYKSEANYFKDLEKVATAVEKQIGFKPTIIRFPGGSSNTVSKKYNKGIMTRLAKQVTKKGYTYFDWNVDSTDASANKVSAKKILNNVMTYSKNKNSICVLMHDTSSKTTTVEALPKIICYLRGQGFRFEALTTDSGIFHHGINN